MLRAGSSYCIDAAHILCITGLSRILAPSQRLTSAAVQGKGKPSWARGSPAGPVGQPMA